MNLHPPEDTREEVMMKDYMDDIKDMALSKLTRLEIAALFNDFTEFCYLYKQELGDRLAETFYD